MSMEEVLGVPEGLHTLEHDCPSCPVSPTPIEPKCDVSDCDEDGEADQQHTSIGHLPVDIEEAHCVRNAHQDKRDGDSPGPLHSGESLSNDEVQEGFFADVNNPTLVAIRPRRTWDTRVVGSDGGR
jgi:hypothetical protein